MKTFTITARVDCIGIYEVEAEDEDEAREMFKTWDERVTFSHYSEEMPDDIIKIEED